MLKKIIAGTGLIFAATSAQAQAPGGPDCGWGNMLFAGQKGLIMHMLASTTNGTSGNATFGMTSGTNGCSADYKLTYGGKSWLNISAVMDEFAEDVARGEGDALNALAVSMGVQGEDRGHFSAVMHQNFDQLFPSAEVTAGEVMDNIVALMRADERLAVYVS